MPNFQTARVSRVSRIWISVVRQRVDRLLRKELLVIYSIVVLELAFATMGSPVIITFNNLLIRIDISLTNGWFNGVERDLIFTWEIHTIDVINFVYFIFSRDIVVSSRENFTIIKGFG